MPSFLHFSFALLVVVAIGCSSPKTDGQHTVDEDLYTLPGLNHGLIQSPINILTSTLQDAAEHDIEVTTIHDDKVTAVVNKGHTIELEFEPGTEVLFDGNYYYKGSLTTPPYSETVNWLIFREIIEASPEQIVKINDLEGNNARHVQAKFGREIEAN